MLRSNSKQNRPAYDEKLMDKLILRDYLAMDRTNLANERTFLAYVRTAIMLFISGVTLLKLFELNVVMTILGYALIPISVSVAIVGYIRFLNVRKKIRQADKATMELDSANES